MRHIYGAIRLTAGLVLLSTSTLLVARSLGVGPNEKSARLDGRARFCEALALSASTLVDHGDLTTLKISLRAFARRYPDVESVGLRRRDGRLMLQTGGHETHWSASGAAGGASSKVLVPLVADGTEWGAVEVCFRPLSPTGVSGWLGDSFIQLALVVLAGNSLLFFFFLRKVLRALDPSRVVPERVRNALDTIVGGLVILDNQERILLANKAFGNAVGEKPCDLVGASLSKLPWVREIKDSFPWRKSLQSETTRSGVTVSFVKCDDDIRSYIVNSSPIVSQDGQQQGALVSFEDVTELESKKSELARALEVLKVSREEIHKRNEELNRLATRDPLTDCLNRRSFYEILETQWNSARRYGHSLGCVMLDIDHFKSINDEHGHSAGDVVLRRIASTLTQTARQTDYVCRYGGEEFCILLPHLTIDEAMSAAERFRAGIEQLALPGIVATASFGVAVMDNELSSPHEMLERADQSLYAAKRNGRNQVMSWREDLGQLAHGVSALSGAASETALAERQAVRNSRPEIPFHAVSALVSALAYRDLGTAEHSRRVADLCVTATGGMMPARECYVLEIAALLHDIGKIGVPDSILLKPGPLTKEEWATMRAHDRIGLAIITSAFSCPPLTAIIGNHHAWYGGNPEHPDLPKGGDIPLGARILAIADAYDAIVSDRVYRKGRNQQEAFAELRRCKVRQFDPDLVDLFVRAVEARYESRHEATGGLSRQQALLVGQQMESLADAIDDQDVHSLRLLADGICRTAEDCGKSKLAQAASDVGAAVAEEAELTEIVHLTNELMALCRDTQSTFIKRSFDEVGDDR